MFNDKFKTGVEMFGLTHIITLCVLLVILVLTLIFRHFFAEHKLADRLFRYCLAGFVAVIEVIFRVWNVVYCGGGWLDVIPLGLCALTLWLTVIGVFFDLRKLLNVTFFWSITGAALSLIMVDTPYAPPHFRFFHYFLSHFLFMLLNIYMVATGKVKLDWRSPLISMAVLMCVGAVVALVDFFTGRNEMYLVSLPDEIKFISDAVGAFYAPLFGLVIATTFQIWYYLTKLMSVINTKIFAKLTHEAYL